MTNRFTAAGLSALALLWAAGAVAAPDCKPVVGSFLASVVPPGGGHCPNVAGAFCTAGRVWGGLQGDYQFVMNGAQPANVPPLGGIATVLFFTGRSTVFLKSGATVYGTDTGSLDVPPGQGGFASLITFTDAAGHVTQGQIRLRGEFNPAEGTTSGDYLGTVCTP